MTKGLEHEPWRQLSERVAALIEPELEPIGAATLEAIAREVPEYARPLEGRFGRGIRTGVGEALRQFIALIREPDAGRGVGREVYVALGRGELRQGRTLDSLQAAYRVGARVAWRAFSAAGRRGGLDAEELSLLAEAIFAYIDELSADAVEGYAEARAEVEDVRRRRRRELLALLLRVPAPSAAETRAASEGTGWPAPHRAAAIACSEGDLVTLIRRLPPEVLAAPIEGAGCLLVPDPDGPGREKQIERAATGLSAALGPDTTVPELALSWWLARMTWRAAVAGSLPGAVLLRSERHLGDLLVLAGDPIVSLIARRRLASLDSLSAKAATRMEETALAYVRHGGNSVAMAGELHIHPQTARYRIARLRELLGEQLDNPGIRFELEAALRRRLSGGGFWAGS